MTHLKFIEFYYSCVLIAKEPYIWLAMPHTYDFGQYHLTLFASYTKVVTNNFDVIDMQLGFNVHLI
jgi:hypothetical protein